MRKFVVLVVVAVFLGCVRGPSVVVAPIVVEVPPPSPSRSAPTVLPGAKREGGERMSFGEIEFRAPQGWQSDISGGDNDVLMFRSAEFGAYLAIRILHASWDDPDDTASAFIEYTRNELMAKGRVIKESAIDRSLGRVVVRDENRAGSRRGRMTLLLSPRNHHLMIGVYGDWPTKSDGECNAVMGILELSVTIAQEK